jgi:hypothetical protein
LLGIGTRGLCLFVGNLCLGMELAVFVLSSCLASSGTAVLASELAVLVFSSCFASGWPCLRSALATAFPIWLAACFLRRIRREADFESTGSVHGLQQRPRHLLQISIYQSQNPPPPPPPPRLADADIMRREEARATVG